jgi:FkbM family methyltransferase
MAEQELYAPEVPVIGEGLFTKEYYLSNKESFDYVYERLADDISRKTFINTIKYKISGKLGYLFDCETNRDEPFGNFLKLSDNESFLDLGAYTGDTVADFISRTSDYKKIIALEPDRKSFNKLILNTKELKNISCVNMGISNTCQKALFGMRGGRNSGTAGGSTEIDFTSVDSLLNGNSITYIKMDVEGEEVGALKGACEVIKRCKPKMLISCYHRTDDLLSIPKTIFGIRDDYRMYMRHFSSILAWDTNYYFI